MPNAIEMLRADHQKVKQLFEQFEKADEEAAKEQICKQTLQELELHAALEEELFYPAAREQVDEKEMIDEAQEEHHVAKLLMAELKKMSATDDRFDAKYKVLAESVKHHIEEEESELFPMLEDGLNAEELGEQMEARKEKLQKSAPGRTAPRRSKAKSRAKTATKRARSQQPGGRKKARASSSRR